MRTRVIAALLLFILSGSMQAFAPSYAHHAPAAAAKHHNDSHTTMHSCCPGVHGSSLLRTIVPLQPASLPCGDSHPCCANPDSNNPLSLAASPRVERLDSRIASSDRINPGAIYQLTLARESDAVTEPYSKLSTILRI